MNPALDEYLDTLAAALVARKALLEARWVVDRTADNHIMLHARQATLARAEADYAIAAARYEAARTANELERNKRSRVNPISEPP